MPLSPAAPREHIHTRAIEVQGFRRQDGLWDLEAHLTDRKGYSFENHWRGKLAIGEPVHEMWLRLTIDDGYRIHAVEAVTDYSPFPSCPKATENFQRLVGLTIGPGWLKQVRRVVGGTAGCTHLIELLRPMATTAFQTLAPLQKSAGGGARMVGTCYGWRADGEAVQRLYPDQYTGE